MDFYMIAFGEAFRPLLDYAASIGLVPDPRIVSVPATIGLLALILKKGADIGVKALRGVCAVLSEEQNDRTRPVPILTTIFHDDARSRSGNAIVRSGPCHHPVGPGAGPRSMVADVLFVFRIEMKPRLGNRSTMVTANVDQRSGIAALEPLFHERFEEDVEEASDTTVTFRSFFWMSFSSLPFGRSSFLVQPHRHPLSV